VSVSVDYTRGAIGAEGEEAAATERTFATVTYSTRKGDVVNVGTSVVGMYPHCGSVIETLSHSNYIYAADGLAEVIKHRSEEDRASNYDELLAAGMDGMV
jgi:hypothetical protein